MSGLRPVCAHAGRMKHKTTTGDSQHVRRTSIDFPTPPPKPPPAPTNCGLCTILALIQVVKANVRCGSCEHMCASHTRCNIHLMQRALRGPFRRTLKRRRSSTYEASGFFAVTSASSAFSAALPAAAICASCKPALLCSDGCSAAAVHGTYGSRDHWSVSPTASWATAVPTKASALARACVTACA